MNSNYQAQDDQIVHLDYKEIDIEGQCKLLSISPVKLILWKYTLFVLSNVFICIPLLITFWYENFKRIFYYDFCTLKEATHVYIINYDDSISICKLDAKTFMTSQKESKFYTYFSNRYMNYIIDDGVVRVSVFDYKKKVKNIFDTKGQVSLSNAQAYELRDTYGPGTMILERPSWAQILLDILLQPLCIFLLLSICYFAFVVFYFYFTAALFVVFSVGTIINLFQRLRLNKKISDMAFSQLTLNVLRNGTMCSLSSLQAVPGDIVFLKEAIKIPFEGVILQGNALINQCALTGESVPIVKKADTVQNFRDGSKQIDKNSLISQGTTIIQVNNKKRMLTFESYRQKYGIPVCVSRTNFTTTKGQLIRLILFRKQRQNIFQKESLKFLCILGCFGLCVYVALCIYLRNYLLPFQYVLRLVDTIILIVPASIPVSMTFGIIYAVQRLQAKKIFCVIPNKVIDGGMIEFCCFDKTGTLTEDFMDFQLVVPANNAKFSEAILNNATSFNEMLHKAQQKQNKDSFNDILTNIAANHSIIKIEDTNELIGDPMEVKMFNFGKFVLNQSIPDPDVIFGFESERGHSGHVLRRFQFDFDLQRMSVISNSSHKKGCMIYAKGSPEMMLTVMDKQSIPANFGQIIKFYASNGYRMLAIASKPVANELIKTIDRRQAERQLVFNGFEVFENKLKPQTIPAINNLLQAQIRCVMITGDNTLTGSNISYECRISNQQKGMIICDLSQESFIETRFHYKNVERQQQKLLNRTNQNNTTQDHFTFVEIEFHTADDKKLANHSSTFNLKDGEEFMRKMSQKAERTNSQLCITGAAFNVLFDGPVAEISQNKARFMNNATVFARTKPNDKAKIVMVYQHMNKKVSMCGDGANDCGALKQADIGLSLSPAEASMSAPFTSQVTNISSMVELIKECRCGLATNVTLFNIMAMYTMIIFTTTVIANYYLQFPGNFHFLYQDVALNFAFILIIGYTKTAQHLTPQKPRGSLLAFNNVLQIVTMFILQAVAQILVIVFYQVVEPEVYKQLGGLQNASLTYLATKTIRNVGLEVSIVFILTNNFFLASIVAFNINRPWRQYFFTNVPLVVMLIITLTYNQMMIFWKDATYVMFIEPKFLPNFIDRWMIFGLSAGFSFLIIFNQKVLLEPLSRYLIKKYPEKTWL